MRLILIPSNEWPRTQTLRKAPPSAHPEAARAIPCRITYKTPGASARSSRSACSPGWVPRRVSPTRIEQERARDHTNPELMLKHLAPTSPREKGRAWPQIADGRTGARGAEGSWCPPILVCAFFRGRALIVRGRDIVPPLSMTQSLRTAVQDAA